MAFDSAPEIPEESTDTQDEIPEGAPEAPEGVSIPLAAFGDEAPTVGATLKVTAVDAENGTVTVSVSKPAMVAAKKMGGIAGNAAALDEENQSTA